MNALDLSQALTELKRQNPLTVAITNQVTISECANGILAVGGSPAMSDDPEDARALGALASSVILNIGTVNAGQLEVMLAAGGSAKSAGRPVILDPVAAGATSVRLAAAQRIIAELAPRLIRGNLPEIKALAGLSGRQKGVDAAEESTAEAAETARKLAAATGALAAVTGPTDVLSDGRRTIYIEGGSPLMTKVTGTGCVLSAVCAAYIGANPLRPFEATAAALSHMALAGERATADLKVGEGLGAFRQKLFDWLGLVAEGDLAAFKGLRHEG